jgi:hypothetical protein
MRKGTCAPDMPLHMVVPGECFATWREAGASKPPVLFFFLHERLSIAASAIVARTVFPVMGLARRRSVMVDFDGLRTWRMVRGGPTLLRTHAGLSAALVVRLVNFFTRKGWWPGYALALHDRERRMVRTSAGESLVSFAIASASTCDLSVQEEECRRSPDAPEYTRTASNNRISRCLRGTIAASPWLPGSRIASSGSPASKGGRVGREEET